MPLDNRVVVLSNDVVEWEDQHWVIGKDLIEELAVVVVVVVANVVVVGIVVVVVVVSREVVVVVQTNSLQNCE